MFWIQNFLPKGSGLFLFFVRRYDIFERWEFSGGIKSGPKSTHADSELRRVYSTSKRSKMSHHCAQSFRKHISSVFSLSSWKDLHLGSDSHSEQLTAPVAVSVSSQYRLSVVSAPIRPRRIHPAKSRRMQTPFPCSTSTASRWMASPIAGSIWDHFEFDLRSSPTANCGKDNRWAALSFLSPKNT